MKEIRVPIKGYEGKYEISNKGTVYSLSRKVYSKVEGRKVKTTKEKVRKPILSRGYPAVRLYKNNQGKQFFVHRLVADAFLDEIEGCDQINHKDGNKQNNELYNLERCNRSENIKHAYKLGLIKKRVGEKASNVKLTEKEVFDIRRLYKSGNYSQRLLGEKFNVSERMVHDIIHKRFWKHVK